MKTRDESHMKDDPIISDPPSKKLSLHTGRACAPQSTEAPLSCYSRFSRALNTEDKFRRTISVGITSVPSALHPNVVYVVYCAA